MEIQIISDEKWNQLMDKVDDVQKMLSHIGSAQNIPKEWLTVKEASAFLSITTRSMQNYRDRGMIPFSNFGGKILFSADDLQAFLMKHKVESRLFRANLNKQSF